MESGLDLNLLVSLEALLTEKSVTGAAARLHTSAPAMSRTLARLRRLLDDQLLVRAGRNLVPTPRAMEMLAPVRAAVAQAEAVFTPPGPPDPARLERTFSVQANESVFGIMVPRLVAAVRAQAPGITLRFLPESHEDTHSLRHGVVDIEIGHLAGVDPEVVSEPLLSDHFVGVVDQHHPFARKRVTRAQYAAASHVVVTRRGKLHGIVEEKLAEFGLRRRVVASTPTLAGSLLLLRDSDLVGLAPRKLSASLVEALGLRTFRVPLDAEPLEIGMAWHPRFDSDGAHQWLRQRIREAAAL